MLRAVIIDDEQTALDGLSLLIEKHIKNIKLIASTTDCLGGISIIEEHKPDIVFLDISMPDMSGFVLLQQLKYKDFYLIFTTAHERFAIQAIKHNAADYLLKPIDAEELKATVENITKNRLENQVDKDSQSKIHKLNFSGRIGLAVKEGVAFIAISEIIWIESDGNYSIFHIDNEKKHIVSKNIGEFELLLPTPEFFRVHKAHIINIKKVKKYIRTDGYFVEMVGGAIVEISRRKKDEFLEIMNMLN